MKPTENLETHVMRVISFAAFSQDERQTFQWLCKVSRKNPDDFQVEGREHAPDPGGSQVHRGGRVVYAPTGKARRYCPDYGRSWIVKFLDDLEVHYFSPQ